MFWGALQMLGRLDLPLDPPEQSWRDWLLMLALGAAGLLEGLFRADLGWRPIVISVAVIAPVVVPWARAHPLAAAIIVFGSYGVLHVDMIIAGVDRALVNLFTLLVVTHVLVRWGSGRQIAIGLACAAVCWTIAWSIPWDGLASIIFKIVVISLPVLTGAVTRHVAELRFQRNQESRFKERHQIARELHDTIAHQMSAIAIQAQAGKALAESNPNAVVETLGTIEKAATSSLQDMRQIVGVLRDSDAAIESLHTVADIERIANYEGAKPRVSVHIEGDVDDLGASVEAGLFRVAQESITNARRYARRARLISVHIDASGDAVHMTVADDGEPVRGRPQIGTGYGIVGMTERVALLGGKFKADRGPDGRWVVDALIPKSGG